MIVICCDRPGRRPHAQGRASPRAGPLLETLPVYASRRPPRYDGDGNGEGFRSLVIRSREDPTTDRREPRGRGRREIAAEKWQNCRRIPAEASGRIGRGSRAGTEIRSGAATPPEVGATNVARSRPTIAVISLNAGRAILNIHSVKTSCFCLAPRASPAPAPPDTAAPPSAAPRSLRARPVSQSRDRRCSA